MPSPNVNIPPVEDRTLLGIGMMLVAVLLFAGNDVAAKWLVLSGMPTLEVVFARYVVHLFFVVLFFAPQLGVGLIKTNNMRIELVRGVALLLSTVFNFIAIRHLPLSVTASIIFAMPLILSALSGPMLGEYIGWRRWLAIIVGFVGVLIIINPGGESFHWAMLASLGCSVFIALYNIYTRQLAGVDSPQVQLFYSALIATVCILPFVFTGWVWPNTPATWFSFAIMGVFAGVGHFFLSIAHRLAPASTLAPFVYSQIIYMTLAGWVIFGNVPGISIYFGAPIVVASGLFIWLRERQTARGQ